MSIPDDLDQDKLAEAALAILSLTTFQVGPGKCVWKSMDWDLMNLLHDRDWIFDPKNKAKSVNLTEEGFKLSQEFLQAHFARK